MPTSLNFCDMEKDRNKIYNNLQIIQNDLLKLYKWGDTNYMKFNANKFELLR